MSNITTIIAELISSYPLLYPDRLSALATIFSTSNFSIDRETGDIVDDNRAERMRRGTYEATPFEGLLPAKPDDSDEMLAFRRKMNEEDEVRHNLEQLRLVFIANNADIIARSSVHDQTDRLWEVVIPYYTDEFMGDRPSPKDLSDDARDALGEILGHYEHILEQARFNVSEDRRVNIYFKTWNLDRHPIISSYLHSAMALREEMTGKTLEERREVRVARAKEMLDDLGFGAAA